jgi:tetratricopeptide (TPR) repeat protein/DNA-binding CsgD family transcriptional regulator/MinD-like ATPase involved in chromosome partitioning or flagellar assembly
MPLDGQVVTFYSYKGGVGRTFLVANVAATLASWGQKIACIDWDLEAPGLSLYFRPYINSIESGLLDLTEDLRESQTPTWHRYITKVQLGPGIELDFIAAGSNPNYSERLQALSWDDLFENCGFGNYLESMRKELKDEYDAVLIDSRTGVSDVGGICAIQLPDMLIMVLSANNQSISGTYEISKRIPLSRDLLQFDRLALPIVPVLSRFDAREEVELGDEWRNLIVQQLASVYEPWQAQGLRVIDILDRTTIPYVSAWSFGEQIPVLKERKSSPESVGWAVDNIAALIVNGLSDVSELVSERDSFVRRARTRAATLRKSFDVFISATRKSRTKMIDLRRSLSDDGFVVASEEDISEKNAWSDQVKIFLEASSHLILLVDEKLSKSQDTELETFLASSVKREFESRIVVVVNDRAQALPPGLRRFQQVVWTTSRRTAFELESALGIRGRGDILQWKLALSERRHALGPDHPTVLATMTNLGWAYTESGRVEEAIALLETALDRQRQLLGADDPAVLATETALARAFTESGRVEEAIGLLETTFDRQRQLLGPDDPAVLAAQTIVDQAYAAQTQILLRNLSDPHSEVRRTAAEALAGRGPTVTQALFVSLHDVDAGVRHAAMQALVANDVVEALVGSSVVEAAATDEWRSVRESTLSLIGQSNPRRTREVERLLDKTREQLRNAAAENLEQTQIDLGVQWTNSFADLLADQPDAVTLLRALLDEIRVDIPEDVKDQQVPIRQDVTVRADRGSVAAGMIHGPVYVGEMATGMLTTAPKWPRSGFAVSLAPRSPLLVGREGLLAAMQILLSEGSRPWPRIAVLTGLSGVGKTSVAVEYAHRHLSEVGVAWQLAAEDQAVLAAGLAELAAQLGARDLFDARDPVASVHAALASQSVDWLLIFDNAPDATSLRGILPSAGHGRILITSRSPFWPSGQAVDVTVLDADAAAGFLINRTGDSDLRAATELAQEMGGLPLALEQAAAYIHATGITLADYLRLFRNRRTELLARGEPADYGGTVAATLAVEFSELEQDAPIAIGLLQMLAFCAPEPIPLMLLLMSLSDHLDQLDKSVMPLLRPLLGDAIAIGDAVAALRRLSLVTPAGDGLVLVHRLVQAVTRADMSEQLAESWRRAADTLIDAAIPVDTTAPESWRTCALLLPHALATMADHSDGISRLVNYLGMSGNYVAARNLQEKISAAWTRDGGFQHPETLAARANLAYWTGMAGDPAAARDQLAALLPVDERVLGSEHPNTLAARAYLATWTGMAGDPAAARDQLTALLPIYERVLGSEYPETLTVRQDLAHWTQTADQNASLKLPQGLLQNFPSAPRGHNIWPSRPPVDPHLGVLRAGKHVLQQAPHSDTNVMVPEDILAGEDVPALLDLGQVLTERGELGQAGIALLRAAAVLQARPPAETAAGKRALSGLMDTLGRAYEGRRANQEALAAYQEALELLDAEADPRFYGVVLHDIADVLRAQGDLDESVSIYRQAMEYKRRGDASARDQAATLDALGRAYEDRRANQEALAAYQEALELLDAEGDPRFYGAVLHDIADVLRAQGDLEEAARLYQRAVDHKRRGDVSSDDIAWTLLSLAEVEQELGRRGEAVRAGTEAAGMWKADPHARFQALVFLARIQLQADPAQAVHLLEETHDLLVPEGVAEPQERAEVLDLLAEAYRSLGREGDARQAAAAAHDLLATLPTSFNISWPWNDDESSIASASNKVSYGRLYLILEPGAEGLRFNRRLVRFTEGQRYKDLNIGQRRQSRGSRRRDGRPLVISLPYLEGSIEKVSYVVNDNVCTVIVVPSSPGTKFRAGDVGFSRELPPDGSAAVGGILAARTDILAGEDVPALLALGEVLTERGELGQAGIALERGAAVLQARPPAEAVTGKRALSDLMDTLGRAYERRGAYPEALAAYRQALELLDAVGDPRFYGVVLHDIADVHRAQEDLNEAARIYWQAVDYKRRGDASPDDIAVTLLALAEVQQELGRAEEAAYAGTEAARLWEDDPHARARALVLVARIQLQADPGQAVPLLEETRDLLAPEGVAEPLERVTVLDLLAGAYQSLGREGDAREAAAAGRAVLAASVEEILAGQDFSALSALAQVLTEREELGPAGTAVERAAAVLQARLPTETAAGRLAVASLAHALGRAHERRRAYPEALGAYRQALELLDAEADPRSYGVVLQDIADVHRAQRDLEEAARLYQQAADHMQRGDASPDDIAVTLRSLAQVQVDLGRPEEAGHAGGMDPASPGEATWGDLARRPVSLLTAREHEIVGLVARGLSNRQIADELMISPATAARHVANILSKLGYTSRRQIASWAARHEASS